VTTYAHANDETDRPVARPTETTSCMDKSGSSPYDDGAATCGSANTRDKSSEEGSDCNSVIMQMTRIRTKGMPDEGEIAT
jgi:hypothetical protein